MPQRDHTDRTHYGVVDREDEEFHRQMEDERFRKQIYGSRRSTGNWFRKFGEPSTIIALLMLVAVGGLYWTTHALVTEAKSSFEEGTRAWLAPVAASLISQVENDKPINIGLQYNNVGRTPASDVNVSYQLLIFPNEAVDNGKAMAAIASKDVCEGVEPASGSEVIYPGPGRAQLILTITPTDSKTGKRIPLYDNYIGGRHTLAAQFCIAYKTFGVTHKSAFCYLHRPATGAGLNFNQCSLGNHAD
jgi:hypothetical protein